MVGIVVHLDGCIIHLLVFLLQQRCTAEDVALWPHFLDFRCNILIEPQPKTCMRDDSKVMILSFTEAFCNTTLLIGTKSLCQMSAYPANVRHIQMTPSQCCLELFLWVLTASHSHDQVVMSHHRSYKRNSGCRCLYTGSLYDVLPSLPLELMNLLGCEVMAALGCYSLWRLWSDTLLHATLFKFVIVFFSSGVVWSFLCNLQSVSEFSLQSLVLLLQSAKCCCRVVAAMCKVLCSCHCNMQSVFV